MLEGPLATLDDPSSEERRARLATFQAIVVATLVAGGWCRALPGWSVVPTSFLAPLVVLTFLGPLTLVARGVRRQLVFAGMAAAQLFLVVIELPETGNHQYLFLVLLALSALLSGGDEREGPLLLALSRWAVLVVFFYSGVQKLVHGHWFDGQFVANAVSLPSFRPALEALLSAGDWDRLRALDGSVGSGPYVLTDPFLLASSNLVWMAETALPVALLLPATRWWAWPASLALLGGIELVARELVFGTLFASGVLLFAPLRVQRAGAVLGGVLLVVLLSMRLGLLPEAKFY